MRESDARPIESSVQGAPPLVPAAVGPLDELVNQVRSVLLDTLAIDIRDAEEDLIEGGVLDSLALVEMLFELERRFDFVLVIGELDIESFRTLTSIAQFIADQRPDGSS